MDESAVQRDARRNDAAPPAGMAEALLQHLPEPVALLDQHGVVVYAGGQPAGLISDGESFAGRPLFEIVHPDHVVEAIDTFTDTRATPGRRARVRVPMRAADGSYQDFELTTQELSDAQTAAVAIFMRNVTNRAMAEEALRAAQHRALHDPLTGLPNRVLLLDRLGQACARLRRSGGSFLVMFVDLDRLKHVNDTWGHATGDELLVQVGRRLDQALRPDDTVSRLGGDEFVVMCPDVTDRHAYADLPDRLLETLARPIPLGNVTARVTASIGVVEAGEDADPADILRQADAAMYRAKRAGGNRWAV
jgi:diguanylate cyclase (GGDEF)-like protein/PAS domain S-box-containing protein